MCKCLDCIWVFRFVLQLNFLSQRPQAAVATQEDSLQFCTGSGCFVSAVLPHDWLLFCQNISIVSQPSPAMSWMEYLPLLLFAATRNLSIYQEISQYILIIPMPDWITNQAPKHKDKNVNPGFDQPSQTPKRQIHQTWHISRTTVSVMINKWDFSLRCFCSLLPWIF